MGQHAQLGGTQCPMTHDIVSLSLAIPCLSKCFPVCQAHFHSLTCQWQKLRLMRGPIHTLHHEYSHQPGNMVCKKCEKVSSVGHSSKETDKAENIHSSSPRPFPALLLHPQNRREQAPQCSSAGSALRQAGSRGQQGQSKPIRRQMPRLQGQPPLRMWSRVYS